MKLLVDMNLSPEWCAVFRSAGWEAEHWSTIGAPGAKDSEIMRWARDNDHIVFTHDLDFGAILAASTASGPSVIQVRTQDVAPDVLGRSMVELLIRHGDSLLKGAIVTLDEARARVRILPILNRTKSG